jgi:hypothetical protein
MKGLMQDLRYAVRQLRKTPGFASTSILLVGLGICASVAIFGFFDAALIKPLPYSDPSRLTLVTESVPMIPRANLSYPGYLDWKKLDQVFSSFDVYHEPGYLLRRQKEPDPCRQCEARQEKKILPHDDCGNFLSRPGFTKSTDVR